MLIDALKEASFRGIPFLVDTSSNSFGQKVAEHVFPNSDREETEFLGKRARRWTIELIVHSLEFDYLNKVKRLEQTLSEPSPGRLVHPTFGSINVAVVGSPVLSEELNKNLGVARFTVTFKEWFDPVAPTITANNVSRIASLANDLLSTARDSFASIWDVTAAAQNYDFGLTAVNGFNALYSSAIQTVNIQTTRVSELGKTFDNFRDSTPSLIDVPGSLADGIKNLFDSIDSIAETDDNQLRLLSKFYTFGEDEDQKDNLNQTFQIVQAQNNDQTLKNIVLASSLGLSYKTATQLDYGNTEDVSNISGTLETQYQNIIDNNTVPKEVSDSLQDIRNQARIFFGEKREVVAAVDEIDLMTSEPIGPLAYRFYGTTDRTEDILKLNNTQDANFISGTTKILVDVETTT